MNKKIIVGCPTCKEKFNFYDSKFRPFCCERCKEVDLGGWLMEKFRLPSSEPISEEDLERVLNEQEEKENESE